MDLVDFVSVRMTNKDCHVTKLEDGQAGCEDPGSAEGVEGETG